MSVTVDHELFAAEEMGLRTVGQVICHVQRENRLVVNLLIDGSEPDLGQIGEVRRELIQGRTLYIETAEPREMALDVVNEVEQQLGEADRLKDDAVELLQRGAVEKAMQKLSGCFSTWHNAQESVLKTAQLLRIDLEELRVGDRFLSGLVGEFTAQLRQIKQSLESRDFVVLCDTLTYEATETSNRWRMALSAIRDIIL
jgi:hypothetical protein